MKPMNIEYFLTYADNYAIGYFQKQVQNENKTTRATGGFVGQLWASIYYPRE